MKFENSYVDCGLSITLVVLACMLLVTMIQREYGAQMKVWATNGYCETAIVGSQAFAWQKCK